jgi:hypothetical protein
VMGDYSLRACGRKWWRDRRVSSRRSSCHPATL